MFKKYDPKAMINASLPISSLTCEYAVISILPIPA